MSRTLRSVICSAMLAGWLVALALALWSTATRSWSAVAAPGPASLEEAVILTAAVGALLLAVWLGASTLAAVAAHLPGRVGAACAVAAAAWAPALARRTAAVLVGATMGGALGPGPAVGSERDVAAAPVVLSSDDPLGGPGFSPTEANPVSTAADTADDLGSWVSTVREPADVDLESTGAEAGGGQESTGRHTAEPPVPGWLPERPRQRPQASATLVTAGPGRHQAADVVVHRGDTLWDIVARQLGPDASDAEIAAAWPRWHETNRSVIGDDPDLILPGLILGVPADVAPR